MADVNSTGIPVIDISRAKWFSNNTVGTHGELETIHGTLKIRFRGYAHKPLMVCTGTEEAMISLQIVKREWLPGQPGNGHTANSVAFDADIPQVIVGNVKGLRKRPHMNIRAWGHIRRTVEVTIPATPGQVAQVKEWESLEERRAQEHTIAPTYRADGNVIYLQLAANRDAVMV